jgi:hypothetical protein
MKEFGGGDVYLHVFLTSAMVGDKWLVSRSGRFILGEEPPVSIG